MMVLKDTQKTITQEICTLIGASHPPAFLQEGSWLELDSGIWILSKHLEEFMKANEIAEYIKKIKYAGIFLGKIRRNFGLSMEALYPLQPFITRYGIIKGKPLQKYLYGKPVILEVEKNKIANLELQKLIIVTPEKEPVGISSFTIVEEEVHQGKTILQLQLQPITDLGMYLRNERTMFE